MADRVTPGKTPTQTFALVFGAVYILIGLIGFVSDPILGIFNVNLLHNIVHLAIGAALLFASKDHATAKTVSLVVGVAYLLVALLGFVAKDLMSDLLDISDNSKGMADNVLHLVTGAAAVYFGTAGGATRTTTTV